MIEEISCGVELLIHFCRTSSKILSEKELNKLHWNIVSLLIDRYRNHWNTYNPDQGSAFRSITIKHQCLDPIIEKAYVNSNLSVDKVKLSFPKELTIWIDPRNVCYRIGVKGSIQTHRLF